MAIEQIIETGYAPRDLQAEIHRSLERFNVLVCHRRFGKTVLCINELIDQCLRCERPMPRFGYIAPFFKQAKQVAFDYLRGFTKDIPGVKVNQSELRVDLPGDRRIQLYGADNPDALRGIYLDGVVLDEYAQMSPRLWGEVIRPILADREGWAIFIGTPMGHNEFFGIYDRAKDRPNWFRAMYKASETGVLSMAELTDMKGNMTADEYDQELECSFTAAIRGAYYGHLMAEADGAGRIGSVPYDPEFFVDTCWDLGIGDPTAIWFTQRVGAEIHVIDYYEATGEGLKHYADLLDEWGKPVSRGGKGYLYGEHVAPHDIEARQLGTGEVLKQTASKLGIKFQVAPMHRIEDGIQAVRNLIPKCWFDSLRCHRGIEALRQYRPDWDDVRQVFRSKPLHDWTSHPCDAFRYGAFYKPTSSDFNREIDYGDGSEYV